MDAGMVIPFQDAEVKPSKDGDNWPDVPANQAVTILQSISFIGELK